jgi:hypothetical protein
MLPGVSVGGSGSATAKPPVPPSSPAAVGGVALTAQPPAPTVGAANAGAPGELVASTGATYDATIAPIIARNCLRCHGGPVRNLGTYQNLKQYATSGLLTMMIQPGGPMSHFLTPTEAQTVLGWIQMGQPR